MIGKISSSGAFSDLFRECYILENLISNPSFERTESWSGANYDTTQHLYGDRSMKLPSGGTYVPSCPMPVPQLNHVYYGRRYKISDGNNQPADCRFEWYGGDGAGLNWVFGWNRGDCPEWTLESAINKVTVINASSFSCRCFVVNSTANMWVDGLMIVDLTAGFGAGHEPSKAWCDENIPFFEGVYELSANSISLQDEHIVAPSFREDVEIPLSADATGLHSVRFSETT